MEPIRQVGGDGAKEAAVTRELYNFYPEWRFYPTPRFYFSDFHLNHSWGNGRENYIGDLEVKWLRSPWQDGAIFPFEKLQKLVIAPPFTDGDDVFHRICFRFSNETAIIPVKVLAGLQPRWNVRQDTQERDLVVDISWETVQQYALGLVINDK